MSLESDNALIVKFKVYFNLPFLQLRTMGEVAMSKKVMIVVSLVKESSEMASEEIEKEISKELQKFPVVIPWVQKVLMVRVTDA